jgi:hypothetical protein
VCIRPLLEEEAQEKGGWDQSQQMDNGNLFANPMPPHGFGSMMPQPGFEAFSSVSGGLDPTTGASMSGPQYALPAALLAQFPALAGIQWDQLPPGPPDEVDGDISGRSSFDASSGGELYEEDDDFPATHAAYGGWASDYEANAR